MRITSMFASLRHKPHACLTTLALALNCATAIAAPFAYVPSNDLGANTFSLVDLATETTVGSPIPVDLDGTTTGKITRFFGVGVNPVTGMLFISDHGDTQSLFQIDTHLIGTATNATVKQYPLGTDPNGLAVDASGKHVYVAESGNAAVAIVDTSKSGTAAVTRVDFSNVSGIETMSPWAVRLNLAGTVGYVTDHTLSQHLCRFNTTAPPAAVSDADCVVVGLHTDGSSFAFPEELAVSPDGTRVYVCNEEGSVTVVDTTQTDPITHHPILAIVRTIRIASSANSIAVNRSGKRAYVGTGQGDILSIDLRLADDNVSNPDPVVSDLNDNNIFSVFGLSISQDGTRLLAADHASGKLHFINIVNDVDSYDTHVDVNADPAAFGQFTLPDDRIFVSEFASTARGG